MPSLTRRWEDAAPLSHTPHNQIFSSFPGPGRLQWLAGSRGVSNGAPHSTPKMDVPIPLVAADAHKMTIRRENLAEGGCEFIVGWQLGFIFG